MLKLSNILLNPKKARRHPFEIILSGFFYASISLIISVSIFPEYASLLMVFLTVISSLYLVQEILIIEEEKEKNINSESFVLKSHLKTLWFFMLLFFGFLLAFVFWTIVLPENMVSTAFNIQQLTFQNISSVTGRVVFSGTFSTIFFNNLRVLFLSLLLALFYGAGAVFILVWNASMMGFVIGDLTRNTLGLASLPQVFMKYLLHGIPEILAYFAIALAGGILFISIIKGDIKKRNIKRTLIDITILILISIFLLFIAALIETYISPFI